MTKYYLENGITVEILKDYYEKEGIKKVSKDLILSAIEKDTKKVSKGSKAKNLNRLFGLDPLEVVIFYRKKTETSEITLIVNSGENFPPEFTIEEFIEVFAE